MASDVRFILGKINKNNCIESIIIMTPDYIENKFGKFGKPTVKQQLIISNKKREDIIRDGGMVIADSNLPDQLLACDDEIISDGVDIKDEPNKVLPIEIIDERITDKLVGEKLNISLSTKQWGQQLERMWHINWVIKICKLALMVDTRISEIKCLRLNCKTRQQLILGNILRSLKSRLTMILLQEQ